MKITKTRSNPAARNMAQQAAILSREAIAMRHPALRGEAAIAARSQFSAYASATVPEMTDVILATGPAVEELDPTAVLFPENRVNSLQFQFFRMGADRLRVVNAKRGPGAEIQVAHLSQRKEILEADFYTFGFMDDDRYAAVNPNAPVDRQAACTESARYVTIRSAAQATHWTPLSDFTAGNTYNTVTDVVGNEWNVAGTMAQYITQGVQYFKALGVPRANLELALFGSAQEAALEDAEMRSSRIVLESGQAYPDAAIVQRWLGIKQVHMINTALGMTEEPVPGADPVFVDLLPTDLAVLFYRGLPRVTTPNHGEPFWAKDFVLNGYPRALEPIHEARRTSRIYAWEDARIAMFQSAYALGWENTYDATP